MSTAKRLRSCEAPNLTSESGAKRLQTFPPSGAATSAGLQLPTRKRGAISSKAYSLLESPSHQPRLPGLHPNIQALEARVAGICRLLLQWYEEATKNGYQNETLHDYFREIAAAQDPAARYFGQQPVCVVGDTGVGKSCLMGCLLACPKLAITAFGERGTNVPHEFRGLTPDQRKSELMFLIIYSYLPDDVLREHVDSYVAAIYRYLDLVHSQAEDHDSVPADDIEQQRPLWSSALDDLLYVVQKRSEYHALLDVLVEIELLEKPRFDFSNFSSLSFFFVIWSSSNCSCRLILLMFSL